MPPLYLWRMPAFQLQYVVLYAGCLSYIPCRRPLLLVFCHAQGYGLDFPLMITVLHMITTTLLAGLTRWARLRFWNIPAPRVGWRDVRAPALARRQGGKGCTRLPCSTRN